MIYIQFVQGCRKLDCMPAIATGGVRKTAALAAFISNVCALSACTTVTQLNVADEERYFIECIQLSDCYRIANKTCSTKWQQIGDVNSLTTVTSSHRILIEHNLTVSCVVDSAP
jgi:hypothetical protein